MENSACGTPQFLSEAAYRYEMISWPLSVPVCGGTGNSEGSEREGIPYVVRIVHLSKENNDTSRESIDCA